MERRERGCVYGAEWNPAIVLRRRSALPLGDMGLILVERWLAAKVKTLGSLASWGCADWGGVNVNRNALFVLLDPFDVGDIDVLGLSGNRFVKGPGV